MAQNKIDEDIPDVRCVGTKRNGEPCNGLLMLAHTVIGVIRCHRCGLDNKLYIVSQKESYPLDMKPRSKYNKDTV